MNAPNTLTLLRFLLVPVIMFLLLSAREQGNPAAFAVLAIAGLSEWPMESWPGGKAGPRRISGFDFQQSTRARTSYPYLKFVPVERYFTLPRLL